MYPLVLLLVPGLYISIISLECKKKNTCAICEKACQGTLSDLSKRMSVTAIDCASLKPKPNITGQIHIWFSAGKIAVIVST